MLEFIQNISTLISNIIAFVIHLFEYLISLLLMIPKVLTYVTSGVAYLPTFCGSIVLLSLSVAVILFLINHGSS